MKIINHIKALSVRLRNQIRITKTIWIGWLLFLLFFITCEDTYIAGYNSKLEKTIDEDIYTEQDSLNLGLKK